MIGLQLFIKKEHMFYNMSLCCAQDCEGLARSGTSSGIEFPTFPGLTAGHQVALTDGNYTFAVENLNQFKVSTTKGTSWDDYNVGALSSLRDLWLWRGGLI